MNIEVRVGDVIPQSILALVSEEAIQQQIRNLATAAQLHWINLAKKHLTTSRRDYLRGIQEVKHLPGASVIALLGAIPNNIEHGMGKVDLRDWLLGPKVPEAPKGEKGKHRNKAGGFYRSIPFRHQTPGTAGTVASPMGGALRGLVAGARQLGREVYDEALKLDPTKMEGGQVAYGERLQAGMVPKLKNMATGAEHSTDIYAGMIRATGAYEKAVGAGYVTFRTISSTSGLDKWIRRPTLPRNFAKRTSEWVARMAPKALEAYMAGASEALK
jgi:hypothetical protein